MLEFLDYALCLFVLTLDVFRFVDAFRFCEISADPKLRFLYRRSVTLEKFFYRILVSSVIAFVPFWFLGFGFCFWVRVALYGAARQSLRVLWFLGSRDRLLAVSSCYRQVIVRRV